MQYASYLKSWAYSPFILFLKKAYLSNPLIRCGLSEPGSNSVLENQFRPPQTRCFHTPMLYLPVMQLSFLYGQSPLLLLSRWKWRTIPRSVLSTITLQALEPLFPACIRKIGPLVLDFCIYFFIAFSYFGLPRWKYFSARYLLLSLSATLNEQILAPLANYHRMSSSSSIKVHL